MGAKIEFSSDLNVDELVGALKPPRTASGRLFRRRRSSISSPTGSRPSVPRSDRFDQRIAPRSRSVGLITMTVAILSFSISSPLIKWSGKRGIESYAFWRMVEPRCWPGGP